MSDSELSDSGPSDTVLVEELRKTVRGVYRTGALEELTVKRVRAATEKNLGLEDGFFREVAWKDRSKAIIEKEAAAAAESQSQASSPVKPPAKGIKRASPPESKPAKRQMLDTKKPKSAAQSSPKSQKTKNKKHSKASRSDDTVNDSDVDSSVEQTKVKRGSRKAKVMPSESELSDASEGISDESKAELKGTEPRRGTGQEAKRVASPVPRQDDSGSDTSVVYDEPPPKRRKKDAGGGKAKAPAGAQSSRSKNAKDADQDPEVAETKRLQGWLEKCGVRKLWGKELKSYETSRDKIRHLKEMLSDVGMSGRYSLEKAAQIRETRELQADLQAVQEGARRWGKEQEDDSEEPRPKRRLAKGLENLDFLGDDDGEETD